MQVFVLGVDIPLALKDTFDSYSSLGWFEATDAREGGWNTNAASYVDAESKRDAPSSY